MFKTKRRILNALQYSPDGTGGEGAAGGATANGQSGTAGNGQGASSLPAGVAPGSAAAQAHEQAEAAKAAAGGQQQTSTGMVPVAELAGERQKRQALEAQVTELKTGQEQFMAGIKKAFGLQEQPTPEQLAAAATTAQNTATAAQRQLAVYQHAAKAGGDPAKLLDSASFLTTLNTLDPTNADAVTAAVKAAVESNKTLGLSKVPPAGSGDAGRPGPSNGSQSPGLNDLFRATAHVRGSGDD